MLDVALPFGGIFFFNISRYKISYLLQNIYPSWAGI